MDYVEHDKIVAIIIEFGFLVKENNWTPNEMKIRATYDAFRIKNLDDEIN